MATHDVDQTVLTLIGSGQADTRPAIVKQTGLAASTVSAAEAGPWLLYTADAADEL